MTWRPTAADDRPTASIGTPAVNRESCPSSIFSSTLILVSCPLIPLVHPFVVGGRDSWSEDSVPFGTVWDFLDFFPGACLPLLFPGTERELAVIRAAKGLSSSSSSSSSSLFPSSSLSDDSDIRRFLTGCWGMSLRIDEAGDCGIACSASGGYGYERITFRMTDQEKSLW